MDRNQKIFLGAFIFGIFSVLFIWFGEPAFVSRITREDGEVENLTAVFYLIAFILCLLSFVKDRKFYLALIWVFLCFVFLGEETSWFQRLFKYSVPTIEEMNAQDEFNIHNLDVFQGGGILGDSFSFSSLLKSQNLFRLGFFGYFLILPLLNLIPKIKNILKKIRYVSPDKRFIICLLIVFVLSFALAPYVEPKVKSALAETREMLYSFFIFIYVLSYIYVGKNSKQSHATV
ncbi:MAG: hypothetical protein KJO77_03350 [Bacteroidia bacterium]|nr:hypothetical protein [Bacteroidia bacterium]NND53162.1 hypothetical protein [Flavobacteriaceae bacterium]